MSVLGDTRNRAGESLGAEYAIEIAGRAPLTPAQLIELGNMLRLHAVPAQLAEMRTRIRERLSERAARLI